MKKLLLISIILLLSSCATKKVTEYVPVEKVKTEYISKVDTTIIHDSIYENITTKGDTIYVTKYKYNNILKIRTDTLSVRDSIPVIKEVEVTKEVIPSWYKFTNNWFWILLFTVLLFLGYKIKKMF